MSSEIIIQLSCYLLLIVIVGIVAVGARLTRAGKLRPILPPGRQRAVTWHVGHVGLVFVLIYFIEMTSIYLVPRRIARDALATELIGHLGGSTGAGLGITLDVGAAAWSAYYHFLPEQVRQELWLGTVLRLLESGMLLVVVVYLAGGRPYQLGLTCHRWDADLLAGYLAWLILTPLVFFIFFTAEFVFKFPTQQHEVEVLLRGRPGVETWLLAIVTTLVIAPVTEELVVRGFLQQCLVANPRTADVFLLSVLFVAILIGISSDAQKEGFSAVSAIVFLVTVGSGYVLFEWLTKRWLPQPGAARAIYVSSLLFASIHAWPTSIPLFFLSLGLGYLAYRTQSLIGPIVVHSLFNAVSTLPLVISQVFAS